MKTITIPQGKHRPAGMPTIGLNIFNRSMERTLCFLPSCRYFLPENDQGDLNKLYGSSCGYHKHNSARFTWRYAPGIDRVELFSYCYRSGVNLYQESMKKDDGYRYFLGAFEIGEKFHTELLTFRREWIFMVNDSVRGVIQAPLINLGYELSDYFGGNNASPQTIQYQIFNR